MLQTQFWNVLLFYIDYHCTTSTAARSGIDLPLPPIPAPARGLDLPACIFRHRPFVNRSCKILPGTQSWVTPNVLHISQAHLLLPSVCDRETQFQTAISWAVVSSHRLFPRHCACLLAALDSMRAGWSIALMLWHWEHLPREEHA